jgi:pimeloyl-ACP methyl ester carboxylesterase
MFNERAFIAKVEAADPEELANILTRPSLEEEKALRAHLGDDRYQRMHSMALKRKVSRGVMDQVKGNVVVIHGIMGAELSVSSGGAGDITWVNAFRILRGWLDRLRLSDDGRTDANPKFKVTASGIMKRYYGEMLLSLSQDWNVKAFWFDWRKDIDLAADELNRQINGWFASNAPVHIVAHSMGGLIARTFAKKYKERWRTMWDKDGKGRSGGRLVMLGTPNMGSFAIPQVITGLEGLVRKLALLDLRHAVHDLLPTFNSFVGSYQMLPSSLVMPTMDALYSSGTYSRFNVSVPQPHLDNALTHHKWLEDAIDFDRMIYVAGYDNATFCDVADWTKLDQTEGYVLTRDGDGRVPHKLGLLSSADGSKKVPTYYIKEEHGNLSTNSTILASLSVLLETGETSALPMQPVVARGVKESQASMRAHYEAAQRSEEETLKSSRDRLSRRGMVVDPTVESFAEDDETKPIAPELIGPEERKVEESITRGFLAYRSADDAREGDVGSDGAIEGTSVEIGLVYGGIEGINYEATKDKDGNSVDAIAVGHYIGVQPQNAELALDRAISAALLGRKLSVDFVPAKSDLILTQYTERGIIQGKLGQPFLMPDPRVKNGKRERLIAIAGMEDAGRFGLPELTVMARELCWSLGRLKKLHLATVVIGSGEGNLPLRDAVSGWLSGIKRAVAGSQFDAKRRLQRVTFVEYDPRKVIQLNQLLLEERNHQQRIGSPFSIVYDGLSDKEIGRLKNEAYKAAKRELERKWKGQEGQTVDNEQAIPSRVTLSLDLAKHTYRFGAITDTASVPEREVVIDPSLVWQANDEIVGEQSASMQLERGQFLEELLMPQDLRKQLYTRAPLVMMLDATTARIHWEMIAQPTLGSGFANQDSQSRDAIPFEFEDDFLGTSRGFTRQLRTTFAPPPEPPPPPQRVLRVLVVADPAPDGHLPGAQEEGVMVADLFDSYNGIYEATRSTTRIEVKRLFGPIEATRTNVLRELMVRTYDVLHFAGHCVFEWGGDPNLSGWIFNVRNKELLTATELYRVDRIPKFVFSNACESGITPDRAQERNDRLAPSFAEAFFARGVSNFVCAAWPVDDLASRDFALTLYSGLLGINLEDPGASSADSEPGALPMHAAMKRARLGIARTTNGRTTWGAYQHYGNPYFRFFYPASDRGRAGRGIRTPGTAAGKQSKTKSKTKTEGHLRSRKTKRGTKKH